MRWVLLYLCVVFVINRIKQGIWRIFINYCYERPVEYHGVFCVLRFASNMLEIKVKRFLTYRLKVWVIV